MTASLPVLYPADESRTRLHSASSLVEELSTHQEHVHEEFKSIAHQKLAERLASATDETVKADLICWMTDCCLVRDFVVDNQSLTNQTFVGQIFKSQPILVGGGSAYA
jgi:hypothetical protein